MFHTVKIYWVFLQSETLCYLWRRDQSMSLKNAIISWITELAGADRSIFVEKLSKSQESAEI